MRGINDERDNLNRVRLGRVGVKMRGCGGRESHDCGPGAGNEYAVSRAGGPGDGVAPRARECIGIYLGEGLSGEFVCKCRPPGPQLCLAHSAGVRRGDRKSTRLNSSHVAISYAVFCLKKNTPTP